MLLPFFEWLQALPVSTVIQQSAWMQAVVNIMHVVSMMVFAGAVLIVDLRLLGLGVRDQPLRQVAEDARPWLVGSLWALFLTGLPQLGALAIRNYYNWFFWFKMTILLVAVIFTFAIRQRVALAEDPRVGPLGVKSVAIFSLVVWLIVTISGRMIGMT